MWTQALILGLTTCGLLAMVLAAQDAPKPGTHGRRAENP